MQGRLFGVAQSIECNPNDIVCTPRDVAKHIIDLFAPSGTTLDPCRGNGAFYDHLPEPKDWCEIDEGKDFYDYTKRVDWIISNPPYSDFDRWLDHSFAIAGNVVYLVPVAKVWKSWETMMVIKKYGGVKRVLFIPARRCGFPFGFPCGAFYFQRNYTGPMDIVYAPE